MIPNQTTIAIDKETRSMIKELAGDVPVHRYVKELARRELEKHGGAQKSMIRRREPMEARFERLVETSIKAALAKFGIDCYERQVKDNRDIEEVIADWIKDYGPKPEAERLPGLGVVDN